jgi:hypothetical protein
LLFRAVMVVAGALLVGFIGIGWYLGVSGDHLIFAGSVVFATTLMSVLSALRMERLLRANFSGIASFECVVFSTAEFDGIPRLIENPRKIACLRGQTGFDWYV